jgi:ATP-dependent RNA helicase SUPV3L1/SUV3
MRHLRDEEYLPLGLDDSGSVALGSEYVGRLDGFFAPDPRAEGIHGRTLRAAALKGLEGEIAARAQRLIGAADDAITLSEHAQIWWAGAPVAKLGAGAHPLTPGVALQADDLLKGEARERVQARLDAWTVSHIGRVLEPLVALRTAADTRVPAGAHGALSAPARGLAFQLAENLGQLARHHATLPADMTMAAAGLRPYGVRVGRHAIYLPLLLKPRAAALAALLWAVHAKWAHIPSPPAPGLTSFAREREEETPASARFLEAAFYRAAGGRWVRLDILERVAQMLAAAARTDADADACAGRLASLLGCATHDVGVLAAELGWRREERASGDVAAKPSPVWRPTRGPKKRRKHAKPERREEPLRADSPFAGLAGLIPAD